MQLRYLYHSGFSIEAPNCTVIIDYYLDECPAPRCADNGVVTDDLFLRPGRFYVLCSHAHRDHFNPVVLSWRQKRPDIQYLFSSDLRQEVKSAPNVHFLAPGESYNDGTLGVLAFGSTDLGISFLLRLGKNVLFHAGDLNNWHWALESTPAESDAAERAYLSILSNLAQAAPHLDAAMFPVDPRMGPDGGRGAAQLIDAIHVNRLLPMHFGNDDSFAGVFAHAHKTQSVVVWRKRGETVSI